MNINQDFITEDGFKISFQNMAREQVKYIYSTALSCGTKSPFATFFMYPAIHFIVKGKGSSIHIFHSLAFTNL